jgi:hypothetical protein
MVIHEISSSFLIASHAFKAASSDTFLPCSFSTFLIQDLDNQLVIPQVTKYLPPYLHLQQIIAGAATNISGEATNRRTPNAANIPIT